MRKSFFTILTILMAAFLAACSGYGKPASTPPPMPVPTSLAVAPPTLAHSVGATQQFTATATFSDGSTLDVTSQATWASTPNSVATVAQSTGRETAVAPGDATISASFTAAGATVTGSAALRVTPVPSPVPTSLVITPAPVTQPVGATQQFVATATLSDNSLRDVTSEVSWSATPNSVATITQSGGRATAVAAGDATISATFGAAGATVTASTTLRVTALALRSIAITPALPRLELGANQQFTATATLADGTTQDVTQFAFWSSSDESVLRVNTTAGRVGLANTRGPGAATVNATMNGVSDSTPATVARRIPKFLYTAGITGIHGFAINPTSGTLSPVAGADFSAVGTLSSVTISRDRRFLYAADFALGVIWGFRIDPSGELVLLPESPFPVPSTPISVVAHPTADFLFASDFETGTIVAFAITPNGALGTPFPAALLGTRPDLAAITPDGKFFYQTLGPAASLAGFSVASDGTLSAVPGGASATGFFPRMVAVDPSGSFVYAAAASSSNGTSTAVVGFRIDAVSGALAPVAGSPFRAGENPVFAAADASGRFLYVVNALDTAVGNGVSGFSIDSATGVLTSVPGSPLSILPFPLAVAVDPGAQFVYVGFDDTQGVRAFIIDQRTGALTEVPGSQVASDGAILGIAITY